VAGSWAKKNKKFGYFVNTAFAGGKAQVYIQTKGQVALFLGPFFFFFFLKRKSPHIFSKNKRRFVQNWGQCFLLEGAISHNIMWAHYY